MDWTHFRKLWTDKRILKSSFYSILKARIDFRCEIWFYQQSLSNKLLQTCRKLLSFSSDILLWWLLCCFRNPTWRKYEQVRRINSLWQIKHPLEYRRSKSQLDLTSCYSNLFCRYILDEKNDWCDGLFLNPSKWCSIIYFCLRKLVH